MKIRIIKTEIEADARELRESLRALEPVREEIVRQMRELFEGLQSSESGGDEDD